MVSHFFLYDFANAHMYTKSMEDSSSWSTSSRSSGQWFPRLWRGPNVYCRVHEGPTLNLNLSQLNPLQTLTPSPKFSSFQIFWLKFCVGFSSAPGA